MKLGKICARYLPDYWAERDLQLFIQKWLQRWCFLAALDKVFVNCRNNYFSGGVGASLVVDIAAYFISNFL